MARTKQTARKGGPAASKTPATNRPPTTNMPPAANIPPTTSVTPAKRKFYKIPIVTIVVGNRKRPFYIHLDLLCDASPLFAAAFAGEFKKGSEKTMQLPDERESTFELFADWLYYQRYEMVVREGEDDDGDEREADAEGGVKKEDGDEDGDGKENDDGDRDEKRYMQAIRLFVFADKYNVCKLKSNVIKALLEDFRGPESSPPISAITYAYKHTAQGSSLRRLLADFPVWVDSEWFEIPEVQAYLRLQPDFAVDINVSFAKKFQGKQTRTRNPFKGTTPEEYKDKSPGHENGHSNAKQETTLTD